MKKPIYFFTRSLFLAIVLILQLAPQTQAQLNIQSNPVFSTPPPSEQKIGPQPKPFEAKIEYHAEPSPTETKQPQEFSIGEIEFEGNSFYNDWTVKRSLKPILQKQKTLLDQEELQKILSDINKTSKFKVNAILKKNLETGNTDVHLDVLEQQPLQIIGTADNQGRPGIGLYRGGIQLVDDSLLGFGDQLNVGYVGAARSHRVSVNYNVPTNRRGGNLNFFYAYHNLDYDPDLTLRHFEQNGRDHVWIIRYNQPLDKTKVWTAYSEMLFRHVTIQRNNIEIISGDPRPWTVGVTYNKPDRWGSTNIDVASIQNFDWFGSDVQFWRAKLSGNRIIHLPKQQKIVLRALAQFTPDALPPVQQFPIGGEYTVRGYTEGLITSDRGHFYSVEYYTPIPFLRKLSPSLADKTLLVGFVDFGQSWLDTSNSRFTGGVSNQKERTLLMAVGIGLRYRISQYLQGFVDAGWGMNNRDRIELNQYPTARVHFGVRSELLPKQFQKRNRETKSGSIH